MFPTSLPCRQSSPTPSLCSRPSIRLVRISNAGDTCQLIAHDVALERKLLPIGDMLPLATTALGHVGAAGRDALGRRRNGLNQARARKSALVLGDRGLHRLTGDGALYKDDPALVTAQRRTTVGHSIYSQVNGLAGSWLRVVSGRRARWSILWVDVFAHRVDYTMAVRLMPRSRRVSLMEKLTQLLFALEDIERNRMRREPILHLFIQLLHPFCQHIKISLCRGI